LRRYADAKLIGLLWTTGLRIGEVLKLNLEDVDLQNGIIHVKQAKNFKSRFVPLTKSIIDALTTYLKQRAETECNQSPVAPFFINNYARRCTYSAVNKTFLAMIRQLGLKTANGKDPRLHDLRHTFATCCLNSFYQSGKDPTAYLPVLATYLGHTYVTETQLYLHPQLDLLKVAGERFSAHIRVSANLILGGNNEDF